MRTWWREYPMAILLVPLVAAILLCDRLSIPIGLHPTPDFTGYDTARVYRACVEDYGSPRARSTRYEVRLTESNHRILLYLSDSTGTLPTLGDTLLFMGAIRRADSIGDFDYGRYLRRHGIIGTAYAGRGRWRIVGHHTPHPLQPRCWQHRIIERLAATGIPQPELGVISALTVGYKEDLSRETRQVFQRSGASHVLAVSGLHTGIIYAIIIALITCGGLMRPLYNETLRRTIHTAIVLLLLWLYALTTGMTPSVVRSVLMLSLLQIVLLVHRSPYSLNTVFAAAFLILAFRPNDLFSVSFQLSFAAVIAIICLEPGIRRCLPIPRRISPHLSSVLRYLRGLITVSLAAQIGVLPITLYYFGQTSNYFLLTNIVVLPLAFVLVVLALLTLTLGTIPYIGTLLSSALYYATHTLVSYTGWVEQLPGAVTEIHTTSAMALSLYAAILTATLGLRYSLWWLLATAFSLITFCYLYTL